jgi:hypothetical protein
MIFLLWFFVPLLSVMLLGSVVYDGWRHVYFIYPAFVLLSVKGFYALIHFLEKKNFIAGKRILNVFLPASLIYVAVIMIIAHPYQNIYFNLLVKHPEGKFERDYWGLSFRKGLEYILETDTSDKIVFAGSASDVADNSRILPQDKRERLVWTQYLEFADYYLSNFRWKREINQPIEEIYSLRALDVKIMSVYKVKHFYKSEKTVFITNNDFERNYPRWDSCKTVNSTTVPAYSGIMIASIDTSDLYVSGLNLSYDTLTKDQQPLAVYASLQVYTTDTGRAPVMVVSVHDRNGGNSFWKGQPLWTLPQVNKWKEFIFEIEIPYGIPSPYQFKAYIWNPHKGRAFIDDFTIKITKAN